MTDLFDDLLSEFADVTASARVGRPAVTGRQPPRIAAALASALAVVVVVGVAFVFFNSPAPSPAPVARTSAGPSTAAASQSWSTSSPQGSQSTPTSVGTLYVDNRSGPTIVVRIEGRGVATIGCGQQTAIDAEAGGLPALPWALTVVGADDGSTQYSGQVTVLPSWFVEFADHQVGLSDSPLLGGTSEPCPSVAPTSTDATPSASPLENPAVEAQGQPRWAPDGRHLLIDAPGGNASHLIVTADGDVVGSVPGGYVEADWVDTSTIVAFGEVSVGGHDVLLFDLTGHQIGVVGAYESALTAPGHRVIALTELARHGLAQGSRYKVWNDGNLSDWRDGHPIAFSPDGTRLVVLHPTGIPALGLGGTLTVVDMNGAQVFDLGNDWTSTTTDTDAFSPDGRYFATCLGDKQGGNDTIRVVDTQTGSTTLIVDQCASLLEWTSEPRLYAADVSEGVVTWTPSEGVVKTNIPPETAIEVGASGTLVTWTDAQPVMQIQSGDRTDNYEVPGGIRGLSLSPEAQVVAVIWGAQDASGFFHSYLSVVSPSTSQPLPSPLPTPAPTPTLSPTVPPQQETSDDGTNWSVVTFDPLMTMAIGSVSSIDGGFLAVGTYCDNSKENCLLTSTDGLSWKRVDADGMPSGPGELPQVIRTHGLWIAGSVFDGYHGAGLWTSADGASWTWAGQADAFSPSDCASATDAKANIYELYATDSAIVAEGQYECGGKPGSTQTWQSSDGVTWERVDVAFQMFEVSKSNGVYVGQDQNADIRWSSDGLNWSKPVDISHRPGITDTFDVASIGSGFVGVTMSSPGMAPHRVITSPDGQTWTDLPNPLAAAWTDSLSSDGARAVMIESEAPDGGAVWVSTPDGTDWKRYKLPAGQGMHVSDVAIVGNRVVVLGTAADGMSSVLWVTDAP